LDRDILSKGKVDLLFVEAAVNDPTNGRSSTEQIRGMEGIIRHALSANPMMDIIAMYFVDPDKMKTYNSGQIPDVIKNHERVASHYQVSSINLAKEVTDRISVQEFTWEEDFINLHPSPFGQMIYYKSIKAFLLKAWDVSSISEIKTSRHTLPAKLNEFSYDRGKLISIQKAKITNGWEIIENWKPAQDENTRAGYVNVPMLCSNQPGSEIKLAFQGKAIGIAVAAGPDVGMIEYGIDDGPTKRLDLFTRWSSQLHLPWYYVLSPELKKGKHILRLRINEDKNLESKGNSCRIKHFFINE
jgi:sialidase-1